MSEINDRAKTHGCTAATTAWTDTACPERMGGFSFGQNASDTHLLSNPAGAFIEMEPTVWSARVAAKVPPSSITLYDGCSLEDYLKAQGATTLPTEVTVKTKALLVYSETAEVMLRVYPYFGAITTTYTMVPSGDWTSTGIGQSAGLVGMGHDDGQMKAFAFAPQPKDKAAGSEDNVPTAFGPAGAGLDTARNDVIMSVTLFRKPDKPVYRKPVYRSLGAAQVTASTTDIGAAVDKPDLDKSTIDGIVVELYYCKVVSDKEASDADVDSMCHQILKAQADIGGGKTVKAQDALANLQQPMETMETMETMEMDLPA